MEEKEMEEQGMGEIEFKKIEEREFQGPSELTVAEISAGLRTEILGREIRCFSSLNSTNEKARKLAGGGAPSGTVIIAEEQTAGRGRLGRNWFSPSGSGLWFSLILRPEIEPAEAPFLIIVAALALADTFTLKLGFTPQLKWPNDLLYRGKKLAGILSELVTGPDLINFAVVGVGINVNQESFPAELREKATSLRLVLKRKVARCQLLQDFLLLFEGYYQKLLAGQKEELITSWREALNIIGRTVTVYSGSGEYQGKVVEISRRGEIIIEDSSGESLKFWAGDVSLRR